MISNKVKALEALKQRAALLEQQVANERARKLAALPKEYGFASADDFIDALIEATGVRVRRSFRGGRAVGKHGRHPRTTITDAIRRQVKKLAEAGKTGREIAEAVDISLPSVQNIKKALGLVKARK
jgi:hypothetical protein